ncbi:hypothetical protein HDU85_000755 [Gaertneriomyces sp. JEL0708]|nr:hypothetical protein HDU85_000755 [Gaertneriomyces sp. JEL0708]
MSALDGERLYFHNYSPQPGLKLRFGENRWDCRKVWFHDYSQRNGEVYSAVVVATFGQAVEALRTGAMQIQPGIDLPLYLEDCQKTILFHAVETGVYKKLFALMFDGRLDPLAVLVKNLNPGDVIIWDERQLTVTSFDRRPDQCIITYPGGGGYQGFVCPLQTLFQKVR